MTMCILIGQCLYHVMFDIPNSTPECLWDHGLLWGRGNLSTMEDTYDKDEDL